MQRLSGPLIEFACDCIEMFLVMHRLVGTFWEVLAQKSGGVLVGAALPRIAWQSLLAAIRGAVRVAEVYVEIGGQRIRFI